jgi:LysR family transcriptional regulator, glycine cleavage system transcriptional activator
MASSSMPPLAAVRCFEAAARQQSFTAAARELGMTQAAVSYQVKLLEERLGRPLFKRVPRGVVLTEAGQRLAPSVIDAFSDLRAAFDELRTTAEGVLAVTVVNTFATNWLVPRLGTFQLAHPGIAVRLDVSARMVDFAREEMDVGIRGGSGSWPGLVSHRLMAIDYTPMLSPDLLDKAKPIDTPADLLKLPLIDWSDPWWADWFAAAGVAAPDLANRTELTLGTQSLIGQVALGGHGVGILTPAFFKQELASGRLVQPFPLVRQQGHYWLVYAHARRRLAKINAFRDWLLGAIAAEA